MNLEGKYTSRRILPKERPVVNPIQVYSAFTDNSGGDVLRIRFLAPTPMVISKAIAYVSKLSAQKATLSIKTTTKGKTTEHFFELADGLNSVEASFSVEAESRIVLELQGATAEELWVSFLYLMVSGV